MKTLDPVVASTLVEIAGKRRAERLDHLTLLNFDYSIEELAEAVEQIEDDYVKDLQFIAKWHERSKTDTAYSNQDEHLDQSDHVDADPEIRIILEEIRPINGARVMRFENAGPLSGLRVLFNGIDWFNGMQVGEVVSVYVDGEPHSDGTTCLTVARRRPT